MKYDEFKLHGREAFSEYQFYKGEDENPYSYNQYPIQFKWWNFEKDYHDNYKPSGNWKSFSSSPSHWRSPRSLPASFPIPSDGPWFSRRRRLR